MPNQDFTKVFDVSKPQASPTSRPIIVGHRPIMADPMVNRPARTTEPKTAQAPSQTPSHQAKVIEVSDAVRQEVKQALPVEPAPTPAPVPETPASTTPAPGSTPTTPPSAILEPSAPIQPEMAKVEFASAPAVAAPAADMAVPQMITSLPHMNSLPVSHESVTSPNRLKSMLGWLGVLLLIALIGAYLMIDAGLISTTLNLPFHIFSQG